MKRLIIDCDPGNGIAGANTDDGLALALALASRALTPPTPGDDLQAAVDSLPPAGGKVCLSAGLFELGAPVVVSGRDRVRIAGVGPGARRGRAPPG